MTEENRMNSGSERAVEPETSPSGITELQRKLLTTYAGLEKIDIQLKSGASTRELARASLKRLGLSDQYDIAYDCYGAPFCCGNCEQESFRTARSGIPQRFQTARSSIPQRFRTISISSTEDGGLRLCLTAVHDRSISGLGIDYAKSDAFAGMFSGERYCGGRMFTEREQEWLEKCGKDFPAEKRPGRECGWQSGKRLEGEAAWQPGKRPGREAVWQRERNLLLAELFSGKEAALKALANIIRRKIPGEEAKKWRMEFRDFEIRIDDSGNRWAAAFGRTAETVEFLGMREIKLHTVRVADGAVTVGVGIESDTPCSPPYTVNSAL